jgi:hypothetical protein
MKYPVRRFKSLELALKEMEPYVRDGAHLQTGKPFKQLGVTRDFIAPIGGVFNVVVALVEGGDAVIPSCSAGAHASPSVDDVPAGLREVKPRPAGCRQLEYTVTQPGPAFLDSVPSHFIKL